MYKNDQMMEVSLNELEDLDEIHYCINCLDEGSGKRGVFAFDLQLYDWNLGHWSISPVFNTPDQFYAWARKKGLPYHRRGELFVMTRKFE